MTQQEMTVEVTTEDVQFVMRADPVMALRVQNQALIRKLGEAQGEVARLTQELGQARNGKNKKGG